MNMKGIDIVRDNSGKIREIKFHRDVDANLINDVWRLVKIRARQQTHFTSKDPQKSASHRISKMRFRELIRESKASGELSEAAFFQLTPAWQQKRERLS
jgi:hypothetical protein